MAVTGILGPKPFGEGGAYNVPGKIEERVGRIATKPEILTLDGRLRSVVGFTDQL